MKAVVCRTLGRLESLLVEDMPEPSPGVDELVVEVRAAGVNFPDLMMVQGVYQDAPALPFVPGVEVAGVVVRAGLQVRGFRPGDRVLAGVTQGGFAERVLVSAGRALHLPAGIDDIAAAGMLITYGTAVHALRQRASLQPGETLLVLGAAGGVGIAAVQVGKALDARVIAAASNDEKLEFARDHGADALVNYGHVELRNQVKALTGGKGADVIYDPVGGDLFDEAARCINWNGRLLVVGFASGRVPRFPANLALVKGFSVVGVYWGRVMVEQPELFADNLRQLFEWYRSGRVKPYIDEVIPLADAPRALKRIADREVKGKLILTP
jgi:NADPH2:quinone reductase